MTNRIREVNLGIGNKKNTRSQPWNWKYIISRVREVIGIGEVCVKDGLGFVEEEQLRFVTRIQRHLRYIPS